MDDIKEMQEKLKRVKRIINSILIILSLITIAVGGFRGLGFYEYSIVGDAFKDGMIVMFSIVMLIISIKEIKEGQ